MNESISLPKRSGAPSKPEKRPKSNINIPSIKQMVCAKATRYSSEGVGDYLFLPVGKSRPLMDTSKLAKEWANT